MNLNGRKLFLVGFIVVLLVGIPLTIYLLQQQQVTKSRAEKSTIVSFSPDSTQAAPLQKSVGDSIPLDVSVDPGKNLVSFVKLEIQYDPDVLATASANAFQANTTAFPSVLEGPVYTPGKIAVTLSVGPDPTKAIQQKVKAATITFKALKDTPPGTPTLVSYSTNTQVLSLGSNDQASENVLSTSSPATIAIGGAAIPSGTATPTVPVTNAPSPLPTDIPTAAPSAAPSSAPSDVPTAAPTSPAGSGAPNQAPLCNSLVVDRSPSGSSPFSITFTANGSDTDGTLTKATFNFGDGQVSDVTNAGGVGTATVNAQASHTYNNPGTFQATAILTDSASGVSIANDNCKQTITVTAAGSAGGSSSGSGGGVAQTNPTTPVTGTTETAMGIGIGVILLTVGGAFLFFLL